MLDDLTPIARRSRRVRRHTFAAPLAVACALGLSVLSVAQLGVPATADAAPTPAAMPLERVVAKVEPSIVYLKTSWSVVVYDTRNKSYLHDRKPIAFTAQCTGFYVNPDGYIGSAGHCVNWADARDDAIRFAAETAIEDHYYKDKTLTVDQVVRLTGNKDYRFVQRRSRSLVYSAAQMAGFSGVKPIQARVIYSDPIARSDIAILKVPTRHASALLLARDTDVQVGERAVSIGYPALVSDVTDPSLEPSFKDGTISSKRQRNRYPVYEISAAVGHGQSGGPTVSESGDVLGINSFAALGTETSFNFIRVAATLQQALAAHGIKNETDEVERDYLAGLDAYYAGNRSEAIKHFDSVLAVVPDHAFAGRYRRLALGLPKDGGGSSYGRVVILIACAVLAIGAALAAARALGRSRRRSARPACAPAAIRAASVVASAAASATAPFPAATRPGSQDPLHPAAPTDETVIAGGRSQVGVNETLVLVVDATHERHPISRTLVIGRASDDITVADAEASRQHASISPLSNVSAEVSDLGSQNGTFVNGQRIGSLPVRLRGGDVITIGTTSLHIERVPH